MAGVQTFSHSGQFAFELINPIRVPKTHCNPGKHACMQASLLYFPDTHAFFATSISVCFPISACTSAWQPMALSWHSLAEGSPKHLCQGRHALRQARFGVALPSSAVHEFGHLDVSVEEQYVRASAAGHEDAVGNCPLQMDTHSSHSFVTATPAKLSITHLMPL